MKRRGEKCSNARRRRIYALELKNKIGTLGARPTEKKRKREVSGRTGDKQKQKKRGLTHVMCVDVNNGGRETNTKEGRGKR